MTIAQGGLPAIAGGKPVRPDFLVFGAPAIGEEEIAEVVDTMRSGWIGFGPKCLRFESEFARYAEAPYAVSLGSCTAGLHLALIAAGVGPGDEVITTPLTFVATANVIELVGATPVFADVDRHTQNIDPERLEAAITSKTKAIIPVHMAGRPCDMDALTDIATRHDLIVIEDAAHSVEGAWAGRKIGSISRFTAFSFYATKNLTTAEGGMLTVLAESDADRLRVLRLHGISRDAWNRYSSDGVATYEAIEPGFKYNMTDIQGAIGIHQLARLEANLVVRSQIWEAYDSAFAGVPQIEIPAPAGPHERHARHLYTILIRPDRLIEGRAAIIQALRAENIGSGIHFLPVHLHAYYSRKYGYSPGAFPSAEEIGSRTISLPFSARLSDADVNDVVSAVLKVVRHYGR
jgi:dTDP-4-amino-4,6-dideoxygalactose transaminase